MLCTDDKFFQQLRIPLGDLCLSGKLCNTRQIQKLLHCNPTNCTNGLCSSNRQVHKKIRIADATLAVPV